MADAGGLLPGLPGPSEHGEACGELAPQLGEGKAYLLPTSPVRVDLSPQQVHLAARACFPSLTFTFCKMGHREVEGEWEGCLVTPWLCRDPGRCCGRHSRGHGGSKCSALEPWSEGHCNLDPRASELRGCLCPTPPHMGRPRPRGRGCSGPMVRQGWCGSLGPGPQR